MDWLLFAFALELGAIQGSEIPVDVSSYVQMESKAIVLRHLEVGGVMRSYQVPDAPDDWYVYRMDYTVSATVRFGGLSFGVENFCSHPVVPRESPRFPLWDNWHRNIFVRISTNSLPSF